MKFARYGYDVLIITLAVGLGIIVGGLFVDTFWLRILLIALGLFLCGFALWFFRDPDRELPGDASEAIVLSPADGKVFLVHDVEETEYLKGPGTLIAIFLSPLDVHVNRNPISGTVEHVAYHKGKFTPAFTDKSSEVNERTHIGIRGAGFKVFMKQIAGSVARRIVCPLKPGDEVVMGERFGMIKFGSRTDVVVPPDMIVEVKPGDRVVGGVTVLARTRGA